MAAAYGVEKEKALEIFKEDDRKNVEGDILVKKAAQLVEDSAVVLLAAIDECTYFLYYKQNDCYGAIAGKHDDRVRPWWSVEQKR